MTKADLSQWVTAATNIAVLLGVLLLVFELRQNAELARLEMIQDRIDAFQQAEAGFYDPALSQAWVKSIEEPVSMTLAEIRMMDAYIAINMAQMMRNMTWKTLDCCMEGPQQRSWRGISGGFSVVHLEKPPGNSLERPGLLSYVSSPAQS